MLEIIDNILPYISGMWTLPWILVGFTLTLLLSKIVGRDRIDTIMRKIGLTLLYFFVPVLLFRIFLNTDLGVEQLEFVGIVFASLLLMYLLAYYYAKHNASKTELKGRRRSCYIKTVLTNQGRSSAFIGSAMLAIPAFRVPAGLYICLVGIALFAVIPYLLARMHSNKLSNALPWFLRVYPWYLLAFVIAGISLHNLVGLDTTTLGDFGRLLKFYSALTIPAALYYVGAGIRPTDLRLDTIGNYWVRHIFLLTVVITPLVMTLLFATLYLVGLIPLSWFGVIIINSILPITSTNMFLVPYGIDKRTTALAITWTTIVCVPISVLLIYLFSFYL